MGRINVTSPIFAELSGSNHEFVTQQDNCVTCETSTLRGGQATPALLLTMLCTELGKDSSHSKLTWLVLGGDPVARSHRVEQFTAL